MNTPKINGEQPSQPKLTDSSSGTETKELSTDSIFHILQNQRRRSALRYLAETEGSVQMRDLAEQVAAWEHDTTVQALSSDERQRVYIALYQSHLPKLDNEGIIEYNQSRGTVEPTPVADQVAPYLQSTSDGDSEPGEQSDAESNVVYYSGVLGLSTLVVGSAAAGLSTASMLVVTTIGLAAIFALLVMLRVVGE